MRIFGGVALIVVLLGLAGCSYEKLPTTPGEWKTQVEKAKEAQNPTPPGGE